MPKTKNFVSEADLEDVTINSEQDVDQTGPKLPKLWESEFEDYCLGLLSVEHKEITENGRPLAKGLRRLVRDLIGPTVESYPIVKQFPSKENEGTATTEYVLVVENRYQLKDNELPYMMRFGEASHAFHGNINGEDFQVHTVAVSSTRSEVRALRKLLNIGIAAAEEMSNDAPVGITSGQRNKIDILASRCDLSVKKILAKMGFKSIREVKFDKAQQILGRLADFQNGSSEVPEDLKGYDPEWNQ